MMKSAGKTMTQHTYQNSLLPAEDRL